MTAFVRNLTEGVGLVVAVPVAVRARNFAGRIEAFLINGHARLLLAASALGVGFGVGKTMLFRRSALAKAGGIAALSDTLAEDTAISLAFARQGLKTVFSHRTVAQETGARTFREIYERQSRWSIVRRKHERFTFPLEPLASPLPAAVAGALAAPLVSCPAWLGFFLTLLLWFTAETGFALCKGWEVSRWSPLAFLGREFLALVAWLRAFTTHNVVWAEVRFDARQGARVREIGGLAKSCSKRPPRLRLMPSGLKHNRRGVGKPPPALPRDQNCDGERRDHANLCSGFEQLVSAVAVRKNLHFWGALS